MHRSALVLAIGGLVFSTPGCGSSGDEIETVTSDDDSAGVGGPVSLASIVGDPELDLDGVPPESVPLVVTQYLTHVATAVADEVGPALYVGSQLDLPDSPDVSITLFGTDVQRLTDALDRVATEERNRFTVMASDYSRRELEQFVTDADARLANAGIEATAWVGLGHIGVFVVTPDGQPDPDIERTVRMILDGLPFEIEFTSPLVPFDS